MQVLPSLPVKISIELSSPSCHSIPLCSHLTWMIGNCSCAIISNGGVLHKLSPTVMQRTMRGVVVRSRARLVFSSVWGGKRGGKVVEAALIYIGRWDLSPGICTYMRSEKWGARLLCLFFVSVAVYKLFIAWAGDECRAVLSLRS